MADSGYQGQLAGPNPTTGLRYGYDGAQSFVLDITPRLGGWTDITNTPTFVYGPPDYARSSALANWEARIPLSFLYNATDALGAGVLYKLTGVTIYYYRQAAADQLSFAIIETTKNGGAAFSSVAGYTHADMTTTAAWDVFTAALAYSLDPGAKSYHVDLGLLPNGAAADSRYGAILLTFTKTAVE
jgi:hypothetical protein